MMLDAVLPWVMGTFVLALLLNVWRLFKGPALPDRILALDTLYINALALLLLLGIRIDRTVYFEVAMVISMLGFVGTVVLSRYLLRGSIVR